MNFDWDAGNHAKCRKHGLSIQDIEHAMRSGPRVAPDTKHSDLEQRFIAIGRTTAGRHVFIAFCRRGDAIRPISARYMHEREIRAYEIAQGSEPDH